LRARHARIISTVCVSEKEKYSCSGGANNSENQHDASQSAGFAFQLVSACTHKRVHQETAWAMKFRTTGDVSPRRKMANPDLT
jgi:hypothetical protein